MAIHQGRRYPGSDFVLALVGLPFIAILGVCLSLVFETLGYHTDKGALRISSIVAIVIGPIVENSRSATPYEGSRS